MQPKSRLKTLIPVFFALLLVGVYVIYGDAFDCWDFRNNLWGPAYLITQHQSPYKVDQLFDLGNAVWMPMAIGLFFPLGFLSLQQASNLWFVFNLIWLLLIVWISSETRHPKIFLVAMAVLLFLIFPPSVTHLWSGQITILLSLLFLIIGIWGDEMPAFLLAGLMALSLSKPQLAVLVIPGYLIYRIKKYGIQKTIRLILYLVAWILILTIPLFLAYPRWFPDFLFALNQNPSWAHPSSLRFLTNTIPDFSQAIWTVFAISLFIVNVWLWITMPARIAVFWSLALTVLVTPYVWTWDFVMLLPLFIYSLFQAKEKLSFGILITGYIICWLLITNMKSRGLVNESLFWWIPWVLMSFIIFSKLVKHGSGSRLDQPGLNA